MVIKTRDSRMESGMQRDIYIGHEKLKCNFFFFAQLIAIFGMRSYSIMCNVNDHIINHCFTVMRISTNLF